MIDSVSGSSASPASIALVDAHVHIHECFRLHDFLTSAAKNFIEIAKRVAPSSEYAAVLCLTETCRARKFDELSELADDSSPTADVNLGGWRVRRNDEPESLTVSHPDLGKMTIVAGKQIVVAERLEVLALGCNDQWSDGQAASDVIDSLIGDKRIAVLPWGFGKWLGSRGEILRGLLDKHQSRFLFLGDNSGRPTFFSEPKEFALGRSKGLKVLPGTDPLPFPAESGRAGSFGFVADIRPDERRPWTSLAGHIASPEAQIEPFGRLESPLRFARNQVAMQLMIRKSRGTS